MKMDELRTMYKFSYEIARGHYAKPNANLKQHLTVENLYERLHTLSDMEQIYMRYHAIRHDLSAAVPFLESLDPDFLLEYGLQFPEYGLIFTKESKSLYPGGCHPEQLYWGSQYLSDIVITKHPCFSPVILHAHHFFEGIYVLEGALEHTVSNQTFPMKEGDFCILSPNVTHAISVFSKDTVVLNLLIRRSTFEDVFFNLLQSHNILSFFFMNHFRAKNTADYILFHTMQDSQLKNELLEMFVEFENKQDYYSESLNAQLAVFIAHLLRGHEAHYELPQVVQQTQIRTFDLIRYIQENYRTVTLQSLAGHYHYSLEYVSRLIKAGTGKNFTQILRDIRMRRAVNLLCNSDFSLSYISENIGYNNPEHFIRTFKKVYGQTPSEYRQENAEGKGIGKPCSG